MKKSFVTALSMALLVGAASTSFAAVNPFSDVPTDHWAYDAVSRLAADGVIEGYGDTSFQGGKNITRYEMAQMVAKAMAKNNVKGEDKALVDKLSTEFSSELNNLGVRISNLERNADTFQWHGKMQYKYYSKRFDADATNATPNRKSNKNRVLLRLEPIAEINNHWTARTRIEAQTQMNTDAGGDAEKLDMNRLWVEGKYDNFKVRFGRMATWVSTDLLDTTWSGGQVDFGKKVKVSVGAGRLNLSTDGNDFMKKSVNSTGANAGFALTDTTANYQLLGLNYEAGKFRTELSYHHLNSQAFTKLTEAQNALVYHKGGTSDDMSIWVLSGGYRFNKNLGIQGIYGQNTEADNQDKAAVFEIDYKGANKKNVGSWGAYAAYRDLGAYAAPFATWDVFKGGIKGTELGVSYTLFPNVVAKGVYVQGETKVNSEQYKSIFSKVEFYF